VVHFFFLFLAFNTTQNFETTINEDAGRISLGILYGCFSLTNVFSGYLVKFFGNRQALLFGAATYVVYVGSNIVVIEALLFATSGLIGIGASMLWTAQGDFLARQAHDGNMGFYSGLFWMLFQANGLIGNVVAAVVITNNAPAFLFAVLTILACVCPVIMCFFVYPKEQLQPVQPLLTSVDDDQQQQQQQHSLMSIQQEQETLEQLRKEKETSSVLATLQVFLNERMLHLIPLMIFSGLTQSYFFGSFSALIGDQGEQWIGWVQATLSLADTIGSVVAGRVSDKIGRKPVLLLGTILTFGGMVLANFADADMIFMFFLAALCFGFADACFNTQIYALVGYLMTDNETAGFAFYRLIQASSTAANFFLSIVLNFIDQTIIIGGFLIVSMIAVFLLDRMVFSIDPPKKNKEVDVSI